MGRSEAVLGVLLLPIRIPLRVLGGLGDVAGTIDRRAAQLQQAVVALQAPLESIDGKVTVLEDSLSERLDAVRVDLGNRMGELEERLVAMHPQLERIAGDLEDTAKLLPDPTSGPMARLRDTFTSS